jgi:hypothetical protein
VDEQFIGQRFAFGAKLGDGVTEVDGVPEDDGGDSWAEFRPAEKEGEGSLGEKAVIPSGPPGDGPHFIKRSQSRFRLA